MTDPTSQVSQPFEGDLAFLRVLKVQHEGDRRTATHQGVFKILRPSFGLRSDSKRSGPVSRWSATCLKPSAAEKPFDAGTTK